MGVTRIGINGFGRIGRNVLKAGLSRGGVTFVGINDLTDAKTLAYLFKYDSVHGVFDGKVEARENAIVVDGHVIPVSSERHPASLPWKDLDVDVAIESTGIFATADGPNGGYLDHIRAGAKKVILTVPAKDDITTVVLGVNAGDIRPDTVAYSNASCTTNCLAPMAKVIHDRFGVIRGLMTTVHAYTNDQRILDLPHSDLRRARAAAQSIIPTTTGAAKAVSLVIPGLQGKMHGMAMRVPVSDGSVVDWVVDLEKPVSVDAINDVLRQAAEGELAGIMSYQTDPIVSIDVVGNPHSCIVDAQSTMVLGDRFAKIIAWYDNEIGYSNRVVDLSVAVMAVMA